MRETSSNAATTHWTSSSSTSRCNTSRRHSSPNGNTHTSKREGTNHKGHLWGGGMEYMKDIYGGEEMEYEGGLRVRDI